MSQNAKRLSTGLQNVAGLIDDELKLYASERVSFVLICQVDGVAQYVSNTERKDGIELLQSLLDRWRQRRADIPAHINPDLPRD